MRRLPYRFGDRRMRVDRADQFLDRALQAQRDRGLGDQSVARGPMMWTPRISSYFFSATILTNPSVSFAIFARPRTPNGNVPTRTS
jgi:hypothetical protein